MHNFLKIYCIKNYYATLKGVKINTKMYITIILYNYILGGYVDLHSHYRDDRNA